jgi:hypothetical protein
MSGTITTKMSAARTGVKNSQYAASRFLNETDLLEMI